MEITTHYYFLIAVSKYNHDNFLILKNILLNIDCCVKIYLISI